MKRIVCLSVLAVSIMLSACSSMNKKIASFMMERDNRYVTSPIGKPLVIPAGLNGRNINESYVIPEVAAEGPVNQRALLIVPSSPSLTIMEKK